MADIITLESGRQRLRLVPALGGALAGWDWKTESEWVNLFRPWNQASEDRYTLACFPLVPWSNRITQGGFEHEGAFYEIQPNRAGEPYPIHGDGWLQAWQVAQQGVDSITLGLESHQFAGNPYDYSASQTFKLLPEGLLVDLVVTHLGQRALPYGLGLHPYFVRRPDTRLQFTSSGVWLSGEDAIPFAYTSEFPETWDYNQPALLQGPMIDNCFNGWDGVARVSYPDTGLSIRMEMAQPRGYTLFYRPPGLPFFCLEPITHPIDAFHMKDRRGLTILGPGQQMSLQARFSVSESPSG